MVLLRELGREAEEVMEVGLTPPPPLSALLPGAIEKSQVLPSIGRGLSMHS